MTERPEALIMRQAELEWNLAAGPPASGRV